MKHQGSTKSLLTLPSPKKTKFCAPKSSSGSCDVVSFGWNDFPVLLGHSGWSEFPLHVHASQSPSFAASDESPKQTMEVCPCALYKSPTSSAVVDNPKQNNCVANIIETSDSEEDDIDVDVDVDNKLQENRIVTQNTSTSQARRQARKSKRVQFTIVQVREHAVTLGDHPLAESYPISLDWAHAPVQAMRVDDYEANRVSRPLNGRYNRPPRARRMTRLERRVRLEQIMEVSPSALEHQEEFRRLMLRRERSSFSGGGSPFSDTDIVNSLLSGHPIVTNLIDDLLDMSL
jgi:hypothetical protein